MLKPERWQKIDALLQAALELRPEERPQFLVAACKGDSELEAEVRDLLVADAEAEDFLAAPNERLARPLAMLFEQAVGEGGEVEAESAIREGELVDHFKVVRRLGKGGMGEVFLARDTRLGRKVALKVIRAERLGSAAARRSFYQEAQTTASFNHPHIVTIHAVGDHHGCPYLALEHLKGETLHTRMAEGPVAIRQALRIGLAIAEALAEAHRHGVLHRDLKPTNVFMAADGRLRVLDFGIAKRMPEAAEAIEDPLSVGVSPAESSLRGTPGYMAPERWHGRPSTAAADIWALGVILFELIEGHHPWVRETTEEAGEDPPREATDPPASRLGPTLSPDLARLIERCLDPQPDERPTAAALVETLSDLLARPDEPGRRERSPFRGLLPWSEPDAGTFCGREAEVEALVERLRNEPIMPIAGPSGAGKSSFVQAGVIPRLKEQGRWLVLQLRPGSNPMRALAVGLVGAQGRDPADPPETETNAARELADSPARLGLRLVELAETTGMRVLLFVDQLEELFTLVDADELRQCFLKALLGSADDRLGPVRTIFCIREDFLGRLFAACGPRAAPGRITVLGVPGPRALQEILLQPVAAVGYHWDDSDLVDEMVASVRGEPAALSLLQFTGHALWERRDRQRRELKRAAYEDIGGVVGALAQHTDGVVDTFSPEQARVARSLFLRLVTPARTRKVLGRTALLEGLGETAAEILDRFVQERTIVVRRSTRSEADEIAVELVHEALIRTWPRLARWLDQGREETAFVAEAEQAAELWEQRGRRSEELWQGDALDDAWRILRRSETAPPARVERFLVAGREKQTLRQRRRRRLTAAIIGVLALIAAVFTLLGLTAQRERARAELQRAEAQLEGARSAFNAGDPLQARAKLRMALETVDSTESRILWQQLKGTALHWERSFHGMIGGADISPDGSRLAVAWGESLEVIDLNTREAHAIVPETGPYMGGVKLADHGRLVLAWTVDETGISWDPERDVVLTTTGSNASAAAACTASANGLVACGRPDGSILLWNGATGAEAAPLSGHGGGVLGIELSHDGGFLASLGMDQRLRLWDTRSAELVLSTSHRRQAYPVLTFSPNGRLVAAADDQQRVRVWDLTSGSEAAALAGGQGILKAIRFSPDGAVLVVAGNGGFVRAWSTSTWQEQATLGGHTNNVTELAFDTQGTMLASAASREPIRLWDVATWSLRRTLPGHDRKVMALSFAPDDRFLVSADAGGQLRVWDLRNEQAEETRTAGHQGTIYALDFSPNGSLLATGGTDGRIRIWETETGTPVHDFSAQERVVAAVSFSPDGSHLVSAGTGRSIHLWELGGEPTLVRVDRRHQGSVYEVAFSPDGRLLASTTVTATHLFDALTGEQRLELRRAHHGLVSNDAFSSDSARFTTFGQGSVLQEWATATGSLLQESQPLPSDGTIEYGPGDIWVAVGTYEGSIHLWDTEHNRLRQVAAVPARINRLDVSPDGDTVGVALADGTARIIDLSTGASLRFDGHGSETNTIRFSPDGRLVATAGDGGVVRLWHADSGRPYWRAPALLGKPLALLTHQGWRGLDPPAGLLPPPREKWRQALETDARIASQSASGELLCVGTFLGSLEIWDTSSDRRIAQLADVAVRQVLALDTACAVRTENGQALLVNRAGPKRLLRENAVAVAASGNQVLVAGEGLLTLHDAAGDELARVTAKQRTTALIRCGDSIVLGSEGGALDRIALADGRQDRIGKPSDMPPAAVTRLLPGPMRTVVAGYSNGQIGVWSLDTGSLLLAHRLHGPVQHLRLHSDKLLVATDLGDFRVIPLRSLMQSRCQLLQEVWDDVPVVWEGGRPIRRPPPDGHECSAPF